VIGYYKYQQNQKDKRKVPIVKIILYIETTIGWGGL
jgi:hypothetical protein